MGDFCVWFRQNGKRKGNLTDRQDPRDMNSIPDEWRRLDNIEGFLRAEEPKMASLFDMFTRLARGDGKPPTERQCRADGPWREDACARRRARRRYYSILILMLAAAIALMALELS